MNEKILFSNNRSFLESIQTARNSNLTRLSVFYEATQQKLALTKFISKEEKSTVSFYFYFI
jgi:hypothetical protein